MILSHEELLFFDLITMLSAFLFIYENLIQYKDVRLMYFTKLLLLYEIMLLKT